jgi:hypothetical protein
MRSVAFRTSNRKAHRIRFPTGKDNRRASLLIKLILQNNGKLSKGKRTFFAEITDEEISRIESAVWEAWQDVHPTEIVKGPLFANEEDDLKPYLIAVQVA